MQAFTFTTVPDIHCAPGAVERLPMLVQRFNAQRVLIVTDQGIAEAGLLAPVKALLEEAGLAVSVFTGVVADPPEAIVFEAVAHARKVEAQVVIGLGGGSSLDVAKLVALLAHPECSQALADMYGVDQVTSVPLPTIHIPTTAGTGSEVTPIAIITTGETTKMGVVSRQLLPDIALLDANLTLGLPAHVTAATGIDAMVHAIEAYTSQHKKNPISDMYACQALYLLVGNIERVIADGRDSEARQAMLLGSLMAGQAFSNAPVAAVHALAYPLGGFYHIPHGLSNALVLPAVLRFNASHAQQAYAELARVILPVEKHHDDDSLMVENFIQALEELVAACGLPARLRDVAIQHASCTQIPEHDLPMLAKAAMQQTRLLVNNPRNVSEADALAIYQASY